MASNFCWGHLSFLGNSLDICYHSASEIITIFISIS